MLKIFALSLALLFTFSCQCNRGKDQEKTNDFTAESILDNAKREVAAAENGDAEAQYQAGKLAAAANDNEKAFAWFLKAAENGDSRAQVEVAKRYNSGAGVPEDSEKAKLWFTKAAEQGSVDGQKGLAVHYWMGPADQRDLKKAEMWFEKAIAQGDEAAKEMLQQMKNEANDNQ